MIIYKLSRVCKKLHRTNTICTRGPLSPYIKILIYHFTHIYIALSIGKQKQSVDKCISKYLFKREIL